MSLENMSDAQKSRMKQFINDGVAMKQEVADINESLSDLSKTIAEEIGVKPAVMSKALNIAFKGSEKAEEESEKQDAVDQILHSVGII